MQNDFIFFPGLDFGGNDIVCVGRLPVEVLAKIANAMPYCIAFNTSGFMKHQRLTGGLDLNANTTFGPSGGTYVKRMFALAEQVKNRDSNVPKGEAEEEICEIFCPINGQQIKSFKHDVMSAFISRGGWETHIGTLISKCVRRGDVCVDVGANIGVHTLTMSKACGDSGKVYAFEPQRSVCALLRQNTLSCSNVEIFEKIVASHIGLAEMQAGLKGNIGATAVKTVAAAGGSGTAMIETTTLDSALGAADVSRVRFIKIDVQGYEERVLRGAAQLIETARPFMLVEV
jgi:FkbM family methyltransferase